jgi:hypothetical protein
VVHCKWRRRKEKELSLSYGYPEVYVMKKIFKIAQIETTFVYLCMSYVIPFAYKYLTLNFCVITAITGLVP